MGVAMTLEVTLVFELLPTEFTAVQLTVLPMDSCKVRRQCRLPPEHLATKLTLKMEKGVSKLDMKMWVPPQVIIYYEVQ